MRVNARILTILLIKQGEGIDMVQLQMERMSYAQMMHCAQLVLTSTPEKNPYHELDYWRLTPIIDHQRRPALSIDIGECQIVFAVGLQGQSIDIAEIIDRFRFLWQPIYDAWERACYAEDKSERKHYLRWVANMIRKDYNGLCVLIPVESSQRLLFEQLCHMIGSKATPWPCHVGIDGND